MTSANSNGNGMKVLGAIAMIITIGVMGWVGTTVNGLSGRMYRVEAIVEERAKSVDLRLERIEKLLEKIQDKQNGK